MTTQTPDAVREAVIEQAHAAIRNGDYRMGYLRMCEAYGKLAALDSRAGDAGEGWKLVPVEPTEAMLHYLSSSADPRMTYAALLSATPAPAVDAVADRQINPTPVDDRGAAVESGCNLCHGLNTSCPDGCELIHEVDDAVPAGEVDCSVCGGDCAGANPPVMNCPMRAALSHGEGRK